MQNNYCQSQAGQQTQKQSMSASAPAWVPSFMTKSNTTKIFIEWKYKAFRNKYDFK